MRLFIDIERQASMLNNIKISKGNHSLTVGSSIIPLITRYLRQIELRQLLVDLLSQADVGTVQLGDDQTAVLIYKFGNEWVLKNSQRESNNYPSLEMLSQALENSKIRWISYIRKTKSELVIVYDGRGPFFYSGNESKLLEKTFPGKYDYPLNTLREENYSDLLNEQKQQAVHSLTPILGPDLTSIVKEYQPSMELDEIDKLVQGQFKQGSLIGSYLG